MKKMIKVLALGLLILKPNTLQPLTKDQITALSICVFFAAVTLGTSVYSSYNCNANNGFTTLNECRLRDVNTFTTSGIAFLAIKAIYDLFKLQNRQEQQNLENIDQQ